MSRKLWLLLISFSLITIIALAEIFKQPIFKIKKIDCSLAKETCPEDLLHKSQELKNKSFYFANLEKTVADWNLQLYQLNSIKKSWPKKIELNFVSEPKLYQLQLEDEVGIITQSGLVENRLSATDDELKKIELISIIPTQNSDQIIIDSKVEPNFHQTIKTILAELTKQEIEASSLTYQPDLIKVQLNSNLVALLEPEQLSSQISKLKLIISRLDLKQIDLEIKEIDLRFELPVLKTRSAS